MDKIRHGRWTIFGIIFLPLFLVPHYKIGPFLLASLKGAFTWLKGLLAYKFWQEHSSYNLGVAITSLAIVVTFIEFIANKNELRLSLAYKKRRTALWLSILSVMSTFIGELRLLNRPFLFEILGAILMIAAIFIYLYVVLTRPKKLSRGQVVDLKNILAGILSETNSETINTIKGCVEVFESLLFLSLTDVNARSIFQNAFASDIFLRYFSESYHILESTIDFYIKYQGNSRGLAHINVFLKQLIVKSLENETSFLNMFVGQKIYPDALFRLDKLMLKEKNPELLRVLFNGYEFRSMSEKGQLNYIALVKRYLRLIYRENNHVSLPDGYQLNHNLDDNLLSIFFYEIEKFFESTYDQEHLWVLINEVSDLAHYYEWGVKSKDKSEIIKERAGMFIYEIFNNFIARYKIKDEETLRLKVFLLYDNFFEIQQVGTTGNIALSVFVKKLKNKIIGDDTANGIFPNYKGYFPAMILVYFYMFGFNIFSENLNEAQAVNLHIPVLSGLADAFPKLYQGFKQEFYDATSLPIGKEQLLQKQGREIIDKFLKKNMVYNFEENSLSYYYSGDVHSAKIYLNKVRDDQKIDIEKL